MPRRHVNPILPLPPERAQFTRDRLTVAACIMLVLIVAYCLFGAHA